MTGDLLEKEKKKYLHRFSEENHVLYHCWFNKNTFEVTIVKSKSSWLLLLCWDNGIKPNSSFKDWSNNNNSLMVWLNQFGCVKSFGILCSNFLIISFKIPSIKWSFADIDASFPYTLFTIGWSAVIINGICTDIWFFACLRYHSG